MLNVLLKAFLVRDGVKKLCYFHLKLACVLVREKRKGLATR